MTPQRIYLAGRYSRREELLGYAQHLAAQGHAITSRWLALAHEKNDEAFNSGTDEYREQTGCLYAQDALDDIGRAQVLIAFTEAPGDQQGRARGGRHVELGIALAAGKRIVVVGPRENVFCCLEEILHYPTWDECLAVFSQEQEAEAWL